MLIKLTVSVYCAMFLVGFVMSEYVSYWNIEFCCSTSVSFQIVSVWMEKRKYRCLQNAKDNPNIWIYCRAYLHAHSFFYWDPVLREMNKYLKLNYLEAIGPYWEISITICNGDRKRKTFEKWKNERKILSNSNT